MLPDLAVTVSQRRWSCIVDPALLLLTPFGPTLMQRLGNFAELWVVRSFWRVLDDSHTCLREPKRLVPAAWQEAADDDFVTVARDALRAWERIRARNDLCGLHFRYVGDNLMGSALPENREPDVVQRFEELEGALQMQIGDWNPNKPQDGFDAWLAAIDAIALAATLNSAFILTMTQGKPQLPALAAALNGFAGGPRFRRIDIQQAPLAPLEHHQLCRLLAQAGFAPLVWAGLNLAVAHVVAPGALQLRTAFDDMLDCGETAVLEPYDETAGSGDAAFWQDASVFWYPL